MFGFALREFYRSLGFVLGLLDSVDRNGFHEEDGHRSVRAYVQAVGNMSAGDASWLLGMVRTLRSMPYTAEDFADGALGLSQLQELVKLHRTPAVRARLGEGDLMLLGFARSMPFDDFRDAARHFREVVDPDGTHRRHRAADEGRNATTGVVGEEWFLSAHCGTAQGAEIAEILDRFTQAEFLADMDELRERCGENAPTIMMRRTHAQRRADALSKIFTTAATASGMVKPGEAIVKDRRTKRIAFTGSAPTGLRIQQTAAASGTVKHVSGPPEAVPIQAKSRGLRDVSAASPSGPTNSIATASPSGMREMAP